MIVNENLDSCFMLLDSCKVDVVAVGVGSNKDMKRRFLLTNPILMQRSVLVQRLPKGWNKMSTVNEVENQLLRSSVDLAGKTIHLPQGSHEVKLLEHLSDQIGDTIYYYNRCKNQIEAYVVEAVAIKDKHIIYNYIYDSEAVKGSYDEILRYAIEAIEDDAHNKIDALKMIRSDEDAKKNGD